MSFNWKIIVLLGTMFYPLSAWANFIVEPRLLVKEEYTDNVYLEDTRKEDDLITTIAPGIMLEYDAQMLQLTLDYSLHFQKYLNNTEEDEKNLDDTQRAHIIGILFPGRDFSIIINEDYERVTLDERLQTSQENSFVNKTSLNRLKINPEYRIRRYPSFIPTFGYLFEKLDYDAKEGDDSESHAFYLNFLKNLNSKISVNLALRQEIYQATTEEDYKRRDLTGGINYRLTSALVLNASIGSSWINYEVRESDSSLLWDIGLIYQTGPRWKAELLFRQDDPHSVDDGLSRRKMIQASFNYLEGLPTEIQFFAEKQEFQTKDLEDRKIGVNVGVNLPFNDRFSIDLSGGTTFYRFLPEEENVFRYDVGLAASYRLKMGTFSAGYRYEFRDSDLDVNEFQSNELFVQAALSF